MELTNYPSQRLWIQSLAAIMLLTAVNGILYFPSRHRPFAVDQITYMADLNGDTSLSAGLKRLDYSNARIYWRGDESLYRPLLVGWLGLLNFLFGYHYSYWNIMQYVLQVGVGLCLFFLFQQSSPFGWAMLFSLCFSVSPHLHALVTEPHVGGYLLSFIFFILATMRIFKIEEAGSTWKNRDVFFLAFCMTLCLFFFEIFIPILLIMLCYVLASRVMEREPGFKLSQLAALIFPFVVFAFAYAIHGIKSERLFYIDTRGSPLFFGTFSHFQWALANATRIMFELVKALNIPNLLRGGPFQLAWLIFFVYSLLSLRNWEKARRILFFGGCLLLYILTLGAGRNYPFAHHYYFLFLLIWLMFFYSINFRKLPLVLVFLLIGLLLSGGTSTWNISKALEKSSEARHQYFFQLDNFVQKHKHESGFNFRIGYAPESLDPSVALKKGYPDDAEAPYFSRRFSEILFARYYSSVDPAYELNWGKGNFQIFSGREEIAKYASLKDIFGVKNIFIVSLQAAGHRIPDVSPGDGSGFWIIPDLESGILLKLMMPRTAREIEISTDSWDAYKIDFYLQDKKKGELMLPLVQPVQGGTYKRVLAMPEGMREEKFDQILIRPVQGDGFYSLAYLILDPTD